VRWNIAKDIVIAWVLTMPAAAVIGAAACAFVKAVG
jgi:phosphate/sulfate permease